MREEFQNSHLWAKRFLPHYHASEKLQLITYRLADSLPQNVLIDKLNTMPGVPHSDAGTKSISTPGAPHSDAGKKAHYRKTVEAILDHGYGSCLLQIPSIAQKVIESWTYFDKKRYDLIAYVVMPNHVHVLIKTYENFKLGKIIWSWKRHVSKFVFENKEYLRVFDESMKQLFKIDLVSRAPESKQRFIKPASECGAPGKNRSLWQREYWDRFIRDEQHFLSAITYIHENPVKAGLVGECKDWQWSSASK